MIPDESCPKNNGHQRRRWQGVRTKAKLDYHNTPGSCRSYPLQFRWTPDVSSDINLKQTCSALSREWEISNFPNMDNFSLVYWAEINGPLLIKILARWK